MLATFNGAPVITGELTMPRIGRWQACADLDTDVDIGDRCTIDWGGLRLSGTMASGGLYGAKFSCRIVGGAGGLGRDMPAHGFRRAMVSTILQRIMDASGEVLDPGIETGVLSSVLDWYAIPGGGSAGLALSRLAMHLGLAWRVTPSGKVWLGNERWQMARADGVQTIDARPVSGIMSVMADDVSGILPGMRLGDIRIDRVEHVIAGDEATTYLTEASNG